MKKTVEWDDNLDDVNINVGDLITDEDGDDIFLIISKNENGICVFSRNLLEIEYYTLDTFFECFIGVTILGVSEISLESLFKVKE